MFDWFFEYVVDSTTIKIVVAAVDEALVPMLMMHMLEKLTYILCSILLLHALENCPCAPMNFVNKTKFILFIEIFIAIRCDQWNYSVYYLENPLQIYIGETLIYQKGGTVDCCIKWPQFSPSIGFYRGIKREISALPSVYSDENFPVVKSKLHIILRTKEIIMYWTNSWTWNNLCSRERTFGGADFYW